ncbi:hypothetical protein N7462_006411 [Penicillium macrosclerotiorum]|uniref:uncharacterized protein n=1 Tax=Penicillium macrosclerotiorum TaxID=303699 RepID=UPI002546E716|nr:uncharacterized protein N7462_006411 [Penicillium macrosclerotiorum]KAJ5683246.1 hypothetical protein N7462_006411 [Penicillium macrosclerotiorum]
MAPQLSLGGFLKYIEAFNARDYKAQHDFYHKDVTLVIPDPEIGTLIGSKGIMDHYAVVHADARETVVPMCVMMDDKRIFFNMEAYFYYLRTTDKAVHSHKVNPGDVIRVKVWAIYDMVDGKMHRITCNALGDELLGQVNVNDLIKESWSRVDDDIKANWGPKSFL